MRKALATKPKTQTRALSGMPFAGGRSPIPLYHRIYMILREGILNGTYQVGEILPSEAELMSRFTVSRITARRALDELSDRTRGPNARPRDPSLAACDHEFWRCTDRCRDRRPNGQFVDHRAPDERASV